ATMWPVSVSRAFQTTPMPPRPTSSISSNGSSIFQHLSSAVVDEATLARQVHFLHDMNRTVLQHRVRRAVDTVHVPRISEYPPSPGIDSPLREHFRGVRRGRLAVAGCAAAGDVTDIGRNPSHPKRPRPIHYGWRHPESGAPALRRRGIRRSKIARAASPSSQSTRAWMRGG